MSEAGCARSWEVEAARDGRLTGAALESQRLHQASCSSCSAEAQAMDRLQADLRSLYEDEADPLTVRRLKARVLEHADARWSGRARGRGPWALALGGAVAAGLIGGASLLWLPLVEPVDMHEEGAARFTATTDGNVERVELEDGRLRIAVRDPRHRVHVAVPDGEIEDLGTVFHVTVSNGHTEQVDVEEGARPPSAAGRARADLGRGTALGADPARSGRPGLGAAGGAGPRASRSSASGRRAGPAGRVAAGPKRSAQGFGGADPWRAGGADPRRVDQQPRAEPRGPGPCPADAAARRGGRGRRLCEGGGAAPLRPDPSGAARGAAVLARLPKRLSPRRSGPNLALDRRHSTRRMISSSFLARTSGSSAGLSRLSATCAFTRARCSCGD